MTYWSLAATIALSAFTLAASVLSVLLSATAPRLAVYLAGRAPSFRARWLFGLRLLPAGAAAVFAFGIVSPAFLWFEPRETHESIARTLIAASTAGALLLAGGVVRAVRDWRATSALAHAWRERGRSWDRADAGMPVFRIDDAFPTVAVVGLRRPSMFLSERVLQACSPEEVTAMIAHERAHVTARDNMKRFVVRACPDLLPRGGELDARWAEAAEEAADARASASRPGLALDLAQALTRVARLAPLVTPRAFPASAFYLGGGIEARVRRLVEALEPDSPADRFPRGWLVAGGSVAAITVIAAAPAIHRLLEAAVSFLP